MMIIWKLTVISFLVGNSASRKVGDSRWEKLAASSSGSEGSNTSGRSFNDGVIKGGQEVEHIWHQKGSDCSKIWTFQHDVDSYIKKTYADNSNSRASAHNHGVRVGADQVIMKYEKKCLDDNTDECTDLGNAASQEIAFEFCPFSAASGFGPQAQPDYKDSCRNLAYGICEGAVGNQVRDNGCSINTRDLLTLQRKCKHQVNLMTSGSLSYDDNDVHHGNGGGWIGDGWRRSYIETNQPTGFPTPEPTLRPVKEWVGGGWNDDGWHGSNIETNNPTDYPTLHPTSRPVNQWGGGGWNDGWHGSSIKTHEPTGRSWGDDGFDSNIRTEMPTTKSPTNRPTNQPTTRPTHSPTHRPTHLPSNRPTNNPTQRPTNSPTQRPTHNPTRRPTVRPTNRPTHRPTNRPTSFPTRKPTAHPIKEWSGGGWNDDGWHGLIETNEPTLFPTFEPTKQWGGSGGDFHSGFEKGQKEADNIWQQKGSDCSNIWTFQDDVDSGIERICPEINSFCRGVSAGADQVIMKYQKKCLDDNTDECTDLGNAASQEIAFEFCPFSATSGFAPQEQSDYKDSCRNLAYGICEGAVGNQVRDNGCSINTSDLSTLQQKCKYQVDVMTGGSSSNHDDDDEWHGSGLGDGWHGPKLETHQPTLSPTEWAAEWHDGWKEPIPETRGWKTHWKASPRGGKRKGHINDWS